ncbi:type I DNA topoisomerase [Ichthyobacterium seriolicida]|uniref:DNA topoisomerase 1 n=1 Tax=Ichthyobacterium seriolicida TaxID=242600 RepID=A0A1J1E7Y2_9FLAO|nr:type I DNA topoisomerase [Ichthyobacterium seriolicida]BAV95446.1 DNA topoisomerase I [Ichthyobacterium seriolicida]
MAKNLVIVESPAKAKTIEKILGSNYQVESCYGHICDLVNKNMGIDIENNFNPIYEISPDKVKVVSGLKKKSKSAEVIWLASDEDREGEAISWHLARELSLPKEKVKRIVFHEITKKAISKAIENPREINDDLVNSQKARRVLDRLVGFQLSPVLWQKVKWGLSAGRVQSVAVRLIVEREREISLFSSKSYFKVVAFFINSKGEELKAELSEDFETEKQAESFLKECIDYSFKVDDIQSKEAKRTPSAPFTTSTLQQEASVKLGFSVSQTMRVAQQLYESGHITYMRTDSVNLSVDAVDEMREVIVAKYGDKYSQPRSYTTKSKTAQEAHEAIRPTSVKQESAGSDNNQKRLYSLIWKRALSSQMSDAKLERTKVKIGYSSSETKFISKGEVLLFDGFLRLSLEDKEDNKDNMLPLVKKGEALKYETITATQKFTRPPSRFTEASLVKKLEELGIGRPSTYAPTISTIQSRQYVKKSELEGDKRTSHELVLKEKAISLNVKEETFGADKNKLIPEDIGVVVNDFLVKNFEKILDYEFTAKVEGDFDNIAKGKECWVEMIKLFYTDFKSTVDNVKDKAERTVGERILGKEEKTGKTILVRIGKFGPIAQIGDSSDEEKPKYASLLVSKHIETITLEEALDLFKLPRELGEFEGKVITVAIGRFGPYIKFDGKFISIKKASGDDPMTIQKSRAIELIEEKRKADIDKYINVFKNGDITLEVLNGRFGPYIRIDKKNYKIPKEIDAKLLTLEDCLKIKDEVEEKKGKSQPQQKKSTNKKSK